MGATATMTRPRPTARAVVAWTGMWSFISLAAALALALTIGGGAPFPGRDFMIFPTYGAILVTLVVQGLSLPALIQALGLEDDGANDREENKARLPVADAARLETFVQEEWVRKNTAERLRGLYNYRRSRFTGRFDGDGGEDIEERSAAHRRLTRELLRGARGRSWSRCATRNASAMKPCTASSASWPSKNPG
jgi:monovalent cation/hydrogen antiporter